MTGRRSLLTILIIFAVCLSGVGLYYNAVGYDPAEDVVEPVQEIHVTKNLKNSVNLYLHVEHYREGELIGDMWKLNDLLLDNYCNWTALTLSGRFDVFNLTDDQGQNGACSEREAYSDVNANSYIAIGTGTNTPGFTNYTLQTETHREKIDDWLIEVSGTDYNLTATSFFTFTGAYAITEAGWCIYVDDLSDEVFLTRDTFSAVNVVADDTLAVSIIIELTGGITDNYGQLIANFYRGEESSNVNQPQTTSGGDVSLSSTNGEIWDDNEDWQIWIGTSNTAFDETDYTLGNKVYEDNIDADAQVIYDRTGSDVNITVIGYFSIDASYSIYEIGLLTPVRADQPTPHVYQIMLLREVRGSGYSVDSGDNIAVYVTWVIDQP